MKNFFKQSTNHFIQDIFVSELIDQVVFIRTRSSWCETRTPLTPGSSLYTTNEDLSMLFALDKITL